MGVKLKVLFTGTPVTFGDLRGKTLAIDAFNWVFQFLTTIRLSDGSPLSDSNGRVTSHLNGLFYRSMNMLENGITPWFIFDGKYPKFKKATVAEREERKKEAERKVAEAKSVEERAFFMRQATRIDNYIIESSKELLKLLGIPVTDAPAEGEAQAAKLSKDGIVYAAASQDYDTILFGAQRLVKNLNVTNRRKLPGKGVEVRVVPELIDVKKSLQNLGLTREKLVVLSLFLGTDYNGGVNGIGPKKALALVKDNPANEMLKKYDFDSESSIEEIYDYFLNPNVSEVRETKALKSADVEGLVKFMCVEHGFDESRTRNAVERLKPRDSSLSEF